MSLLANKIKQELKQYSDKNKAIFLSSFFKTKKGEYGEGDKFLGIVVPNQRKVSNQFYKEATLNDIKELLSSEFHEHRLTALFILVLKFQKTKDNNFRKEIYNFYIKNAKKVNNWDLVDSSAHYIIGEYLVNTGENRGVLYKLAKSTNLWEQRISIISTFALIKVGEFKETLKISEIFLNHEHDLIHKATGWMLREVGKKNEKALKLFLDKNYKKMPRTMLRYSIEKFSQKTRRKYLEGTI